MKHIIRDSEMLETRNAIILCSIVIIQISNTYQPYQVSESFAFAFACFSEILDLLISKFEIVFTTLR